MLRRTRSTSTPANGGDWVLLDAIPVPEYPGSKAACVQRYFFGFVMPSVKMFFSAWPSPAIEIAIYDTPPPSTKVRQDGAISYCVRQSET